MADCPYHDTIVRDVAELFGKFDTLSREVVELREGAAGSREQLKTIFSMLERIETMLRDYTTDMKAAINKVAGEVEHIKAKPSRYWDGAIMAIIAAGAGAIVAFLVKG